MTRATLTQERIDIVLEFMKGRVTTYDNLAEQFDRHYYTVRDWMQQLIDQGYVRELPFSSKRKKQFVLVDASNDLTPPFRFFVDKNLYTFNELNEKVARSHTGQPVGWFMSQLMLRSLNPEPVDNNSESVQQYTQRVDVAGPYTNQELKTHLTALRKAYANSIEAIDSLLLNRAVWEETSELAARAGGSVDPQTLLVRARRMWWMMGNEKFDRDGNPVDIQT